VITHHLSASYDVRAKLSGADPTRAVLVETNFEGANLTGCKVYGIAEQKGAIGMAKKGRGIFLAYTDIDPKYEKEEALSRLILCGERALQHALTEYVTHFHRERPHQGKGNLVLMPAPHAGIQRAGC
jgi:hypothetical protein